MSKKKKRLFSIVYEDQDILVVDKPAGLLAVPIPGSKTENLLDLVSAHLGKRGERIKTVHRIDRFTSGVMAFAKSERAYRELRRQFSNHEPERIYLAMIRGVIEEDFGELHHHMKRIKAGFRNIVVAEDDPAGTPATLEFEVAQRFQGATLVAIRLGTGLKNQIRVQFAEVGYPVIGDQHYAEEERSKAEINRQALHAWRLEFKHPIRKEEVRFEAKIPKDMQKLIDKYSGKKLKME